MKRLFVGILIIALSCILLFQYNHSGTKPPKQKRQSAYDFFRNHPVNISQSREISFFSNASKINVTQVLNPEEKPYLIHVEGLSDLYSSVNITNYGTKSFSVWPHLHSLLSRSDALPETAKGVKEASVAWKDLLSIIKEEKISKTNISNSIKCPYAVSTFDKPVYNNSGRALGIPCGLIEDSSITLIGIPNGANRSFQVVLEGAGLMHEKTPPIVLHYNVYLPEENSTKEPVIIQNTWTSKVGWGREERCPRGRSTKTIKVDGLASCNERFIRAPIEEIQNLSGPVSDNHINSLLVHAHMSSIFPFMEGSLFTSTLWVGLEGFHMTVNGRHETSFKYRENLEPWLANKVRVMGDVSIFSGIAKGLPVAEDLNLSVDAGQLKAPSLSSGIVLLVGVFSTGNNFERRMALRRSWMQYEAVRSGIVAVRFIIGFHKYPEVNLDLWKEAQTYGDIQLMPFVDYYSLISLKTIAICILGLFKLEDVAMGIWIEKLKKSGHEVKYISDDRFYNDGCDTDYVLAHYQNPRKVLCLWEKLQKEHQASCCE